LILNGTLRGEFLFILDFNNSKLVIRLVCVHTALCTRLGPGFVVAKVAFGSAFSDSVGQNVTLQFKIAYMKIIAIESLTGILTSIYKLNKIHTSIVHTFNTRFVYMVTWFYMRIEN
jgi:hypothetical protein